MRHERFWVPFILFCLFGLQSTGYAELTKAEIEERVVNHYQRIENYPRDFKANEKSEKEIIEIGDPAVDVIISILTYIKKDHRARQSLVRILGKIGNKDALETLFAIVKNGDREGQVADEACWAISNIGEAAIEPTMAFLRNSKFRNENIQNVAKILERIGEPALKAQLDYIRDNSSREINERNLIQHYFIKNIVSFGTTVNKYVLPWLDDKNAGIRAAAIEILSRIDDPDLIPIIVNRLNDPDEQVCLGVVKFYLSRLSVDRGELGCDILIPIEPAQFDRILSLS